MESNGHTQHDAVNHPRHYNSHPSGMECIELVELLPFCEGNAIKYLWRAGLKGAAVEDLQKARWYVERARTSNDALPAYGSVHVSRIVERARAGFDTATGDAITRIAFAQHESALSLIDELIEEAGMEAAR